ncbi:MAG: anthranilate synthase component I family protein [Phycisphaerae bacterium]|nr:anthranilate synthase component I family protein [Phycisphaerae bacterium]
MIPPQTETHPKTIKCTLHYKRIKEKIPLPSITQVFSNLSRPSVLGGNNSNDSRYSYWSADPIDTFEFYHNQKNPFEKLQSCLKKYHLAGDNNPDLPKDIFPGGWLGFFSYELGHHIENITPKTNLDTELPLIKLFFYDKVICYDHIKKNFILFVIQTNQQESIDHKFSALESWLNEAKSLPPIKIPNTKFEKSNIPFTSNITEPYYNSAVRNIKKHILDGDVYQVNFSQKFTSPFTAPPIDLYRWQNAHNPSPYSAYIDTGTFQIVSASPELFIKVTDRTITTKPIKGTRPRLNPSDPAAAKLNNTYRRQLLTSEKEQAELNMIIDLERNDLGRICRPGTIKVTQPRTIIPYPTVFHALATIQGRLRSEITLCDILKATFPGGSITGAPKISAMNIISRTEPHTRCVYTGCIGFIAINSNVCLNIAIRTIIISQNEAAFCAGGGIVADSDIKAEYDETLLKAKALIAGINAVQKITE